MSVVLSQPQYRCSLKAGVAGTAAYRPISSAISDESTATLAVGASANQVSKPVAVELTIATGTPATIDLSSFITDDGSTASISSMVEAIKITLLSSTTGQDLTVGGGTNGLFAALPVSLKPTPRGEAVLFLATPITVDATHKIITLAVAAGTTVKVRVTLFGR